MAEKLFELRRRSFDTPHFRGIEFIEVEAKSILNKVPGNYLPFNWTINPYRGCSHACSYCVHPDTPILMADGRHRPIKDLEVGDKIYGTRIEGAYRRYAITDVRAHWSTIKRAYRVSLADGTELITSGDHRFLSNRGWKHVTGAERGPLRRPFLTTGDRLIGTGAFADPSHKTRDYKLAVATETPETDLKIVSIEDLGIELPMFDITTGTGDFIANGVVSHNCFARATHTFMDMDAGRDFETKIVVKVNAPDLLGRELRRKSWKGERVAMGTATDPYQRAEGRYKIMPRIIGTLTEFRNPFSILTKGTLILRDLDLLAEAARLTDVSTAFSIGTLDEEVWRRSEPGTPHPRRRIEAVARLNEAGVPCGVLVAPLLPGISDGEEQMHAVIEACLDAGATHVSPILLHLRPHVKEVYMAWLAENYPDLVPRYIDMYKSAYARKADQDRLGARFGAIRASLGGAPKATARRRRPRPRTPPARRNEQLSLL